MSSNQNKGYSASTFSQPKFMTPQSQAEARAKLEQTKLEKEADVAKADHPDVIERKRRNRSKVASTIERGKEWISSFFRGFVEKERGNIKIDLFEDLVSRLLAPYDSAANGAIGRMQPTDPMVNLLKFKLHGITNIAVAIKLKKASTDADRNKLFGMHSLNNAEIKIPKKLMIAIDQLGKTDINGDFRLRIRDQHLAVKKYMLIGLTEFFFQEEKDAPGTVLVLKDGWDIDRLVTLTQNATELQRLYDDQSLEAIKRRARRNFEHNANKTSIPLRITEEKIVNVRLPYFDFDRDSNAQGIQRYLQEPIFSVQELTGDFLAFVSSVVFQAIKPTWLKKRNQKLGDVDKTFSNTVVKDFKIQDMLDLLHMINFDDIIEPDDLDSAVQTLIDEYESKITKVMFSAFDLTEIRFSDHGGDAQMVELKSSMKTDENALGVTYKKLKPRPVTETKLKISESGALLGSALAISKYLEFTTGYEVQYDGNVSGIWTNFVKSDFKY